MHRRILRAAALAIAAAAIVAAPAPAALETIVQDDGAMLYRGPEVLRSSVVRMQALGVDRVRITANWSVLAPEAGSRRRPRFDARDPAAYEQARWRQLDDAVRAVRGAGMRVLIDIGFWAPRWATEDPPGSRARTNIDPRDFADFAVAVARRYAGGFVVPAAPAAAAPSASRDATLLERVLGALVPGSGDPWPAADRPAPRRPLPGVDEFALWNEPNHQGLLRPQWERDGKTPASPRLYRAMVRAAYPAVKAVRHRVRILIGNTSSTGGARGGGPVAPLEFLRDLACVDARLRPRTTRGCRHFAPIPGDGWAHHPYAKNAPPSRRSTRPGERDDVRLADLPKLARTLDRLVELGRLAPANRAIYLTEFGYETLPVPGRPRVTKAMQARWLTWAEYLADRVPAVRSFAQFLLGDQPPSARRVSDSDARPFGDYSSGLLDAKGNDKPAARSFIAGLFAELHAGTGHVLLYGRLRLGAGMKTIGLQRSVAGGPWQPIATLRVDGRAAFKRWLGHVPGAAYRLTYPSPGGRRVAGIGVTPVRAGP